ncbi:helix-turn-helix transcriptional regulator [Profundibacter sp.]|uniref:helix-turn-helix transcriptional regulator n=1 Tax=Profundibacter sp. TaxID=3101071 RepID=UPI003D0B9314
MRRKDRLFEMIQILRDGRLHRAQDMAERLDVSVRTIYRDMDKLIASGVPVEGERGLGYSMTAPITLPPLNLTMTELEAFHLGMDVVAKSTDKELAEAAKSLIAKVDIVLPEDRDAPALGWGFATNPLEDAAKGFKYMPTLRAAIRMRHKVQLGYRNEAGEMIERVVRPLQLEYWGRVWTVIAWCEMREDFRVLRVDRMSDVSVLPSQFGDDVGKTLSDYLEGLGE